MSILSSPSSPPTVVPTLLQELRFACKRPTLAAGALHSSFHSSPSCVKGTCSGDGICVQSIAPSDGTRNPICNPIRLFRFVLASTTSTCSVPAAATDHQKLRWLHIATFSCRALRPGGGSAFERTERGPEAAIFLFFPQALRRYHWSSACPLRLTCVARPAHA